MHEQVRGQDMQNPGRVIDSRTSYRDGSGVLIPTLSDQATTDNVPPFEVVRRHVSEARLRPYVRAADGSTSEAVRLYEWNARTAAAFLVDLGHLEVALRNAIDHRMQARHRARGLSGTWLDDPEGELGRDPASRRHRRPFADIDTARRRVRENGKPLSHGQVLSETPFGLWHQLLSRRWTSLWPDLAHAFPHAPDRARSTVAGPVAGLRALRNRIGHHHRIWTLPCVERHEDLRTVAGFIDPALRRWIDHGSSVAALLRSAPAISRTPARGTMAG